MSCRAPPGPISRISAGLFMTCESSRMDKVMVMAFCLGGPSTCPTHPACGVRAAQGPSSRALVGRWPVNRRHWDVVEPQVQAQLAAVVNQVMQHEAAERGDARHREHLLAVALQRPR